MQLLWYSTFAVLCNLSFHSCMVSIKCNETQYPWPVREPKFCCNKCAPGEQMVRRKDDTCGIECAPCIGDRYNEYNSVDMSCKVCKTCQKSNMEYKSRCNATHNAVCRCKTGYRCEDQSCTQCVPVPDTTTPTLPLLTAITTPETVTLILKPIRDSVWLPMAIALLCTGIALALVKKIRPFLRWIRAKHSYLLDEKTPPASLCTEDEEVSKPVQEVCGKCDQPLDV